MEIRTKFNVNDEVWCIDYDYSDSKYYLKNAFIIDKIVCSYKDKELNVYYSRKNKSLGESEKDCFATKEEAQKECDKRNGK